MGTSCSAFRYYGTSSCQLLDPTFLYHDKKDSKGTEIYMEDQKWDQRDVGVWTPWTEWSEWTYFCDDATRYMDRQCNGTKPVSTMPSRHFANAPPKTPQYGGQREC